MFITLSFEKRSSIKVKEYKNVTVTKIMKLDLLTDKIDSKKSSFDYKPKFLLELNKPKSHHFKIIIEEESSDLDILNYEINSHNLRYDLELMKKMDKKPIDFVFMIFTMLQRSIKKNEPP